MPIDLSDRHTYIGASEAAAVLGLSHWETPLGIWAHKTGNIPYSDEQTFAQWMGNEVEETVAKRFTLETGKKVHRVNDAFVHPDHPFIRCHIDRKVEGENAILQCKFVTPMKAKEFEGDEIPIEYIIQEYHELACTGYEKAYLAVALGNTKFIIKEISRDEETIADVIRKESVFWKSFVVPNLMPDTITADDGRTLLELFPSGAKKEAVPLPDSADEIILDLGILTGQANALKEEIEKRKNQLKALLGDNETGVTNFHQVTWRNVHRNGYAVEPADYRDLRYRKLKDKEK